MNKIRVLIVDDSAFARRIISDALQKDPDIEIVGTANNGRTAVFKSYVFYPDVITMDIDMPNMDGLEALKEIMRNNPKPVIMMSSLTQHGAEATFKALEYGAVDFIPKPQNMQTMTAEDLSEVLISKVKMYARADLKYYKKETGKEGDVAKGIQIVRPAAERPKNLIVEKKDSAPLLPIPENKKSEKIVCIGTSTGGPSALLTIFKAIPKNFPAPVLVVQHMPDGFTKAFSERLDSVSNLSVKEAEEGDRLEPGRAYIAPGHSHMVLDKKEGSYIIRLSREEKVRGHRPSIDVLFNSVADHYDEGIVAVIMTGMGKDGADGIKKIKEKGGLTIAQNEETSVVYGMNRVAVESGAVDHILPLDEISSKVIELL